MTNNQDFADADSNAMELAKEGLRLSFPCKLYEMLEDADEKGFACIVSWNPEGNGFMVHDSSAFLREIIPLYFNQTKYKSFQRQLSLYGFTRIAAGKRKGLRFHEKFVRGSHHLCKQMKPTAAKPTAAKPKVSSIKHEKSPGLFPKPPSESCTVSVSSVCSEQRSSPSTLPESPMLSPTSHTPCFIQPNSDYLLMCEAVSEATNMANERATDALEKKRTISPEFAPSIPSLFPSDFSLSDLDVGYFEGKSFYLMKTNEFREETRSLTFAQVDVNEVSNDIVQLRHNWENGLDKGFAFPPLSTTSLAIQDEEFFGLAVGSDSSSLTV